MKKIKKKSNIVNRYYRKKWYVKLIFAVLFVVFIIAAFSLIKFYFDVNKENDSLSQDDNNIIDNLDTDKDDYKIIRNDDGLMGLKDDNDRIILESKWNNIYFLKSGRFAVQQEKEDDLRIGIIDSDENCITPFIFDKLALISQDFLAGYFNDDKLFSLLDTSGNIISEKMWTSFKYNEQTDSITLTDETGNYSYKYENNVLTCIGVDFSRNVDKYPVKYHSEDSKLLENIMPEKIYSIYDTACIYLNFLLSGNMNDISDITNEQFFNSLSAKDFFENCEIKKIDNLNIGFSENDPEAYVLSTEITYNYEDEDKTIENLKSLISLSFVRDENKSIILKSINKEEL